MHVCAETIYQAIYVQAKGELKKDVIKALRSGRAQRRPHGQTDSRKPRFREPMIMISERPAEVEDRAIPGHWEGDLICSAANKSAIGTLVERSTRFTILLHLPDGHDAKHVQQAVIRKMQYLPKLLRNSLTWDQGSELALHKRISTTLDMQVYFRDPHSPWQRGTNENTNGLLRQYFPKGTDLSAYPEDHLDAVAEELNDRPRKTLGYRKPSEKNSNSSTQHDTIAPIQDRHQERQNTQVLQPSLKSAKPTLPNGVSNMESVLGGRAVVAFVTTIRLNELLSK